VKKLKVNEGAREKTKSEEGLTPPRARRQREEACLHAVKKGPGDSVQHVRGADEERLAHVHGGVDVVVAERVVLRGVKKLQKRRGRIALSKTTAC
jgi:hypothetical protein